MTGIETNRSGAALAHAPLCRTYAAVTVEVVRIQLLEQFGPRSATAHWALGGLASGEMEVLGVWLQLGSSEGTWPEILGQFQDRGVEAIRVISSADPLIAAAAVRAAYPQSRLIRVGEVESGEMDICLPPRLQRLVRSVKFATAHLQDIVLRAVRRHGSFDRPEWATSFLFDKLERAEQGLGAQRQRAARVCLNPRGSGVAAPAI